VQGSMTSQRKRHLLVAAQPGAQFVQLKVWKLKSAKEALMQRLSVLASAGQPGDDGSLTGAEDPLCGGGIQSFGQRREDHGDLGRGGFQTGQGSVAPGSDRGAASLAPERLDPLGMPRLAISDECMDVSIGDAEGRALLGGTGEALGVHALGGSPPAFHLWPRSRHPQALALQPTRQGRRVDRRDNRLGSGARADIGACCAWPLLVRRKAEEGAS